MIGLMVIVAAVLYFAALIWATWAMYRWAKKRGLSKLKRWLAAGGGFLVVYLPVFWDHIPTLIAHKYYCEKEAGFWVYKTIDQWKAENPGVMEGLVANNGEPSSRQGDMVNYTDTYFVNQRFNLIVKHNGQFLFNRWRHEREVVDTKSYEVLARYVDFSTSQEQRQAGWSGWKFWLESRNCVDGREQLIKFGKFYLEFKGRQQ